jgi:hypothetical protein
MAMPAMRATIDLVSGVLCELQKSGGMILLRVARFAETPHFNVFH